MKIFIESFLLFLLGIPELNLVFIGKVDFCLNVSVPPIPFPWIMDNLNLLITRPAPHIPSFLLSLYGIPHQILFGKRNDINYKWVKLWRELGCDEINKHDPCLLLQCTKNERNVYYRKKWHPPFLGASKSTW